MDRREFIKKSACTTLFSSCGGLGGSFIFSNAEALPVNGNGRVLIHVELLGGADLRHLFTPPPTTPFGSTFWNSREPLYNIGNNPNWLPTDSWNNEYILSNWGGTRFGIHKNADWIHKQLNLGNLAIICNVKHSDNRRHDHSQLIMNSGKPDIANYDYETSGWGGRIAQSMTSAKVVSMVNKIGLFCKSDDITNRNSHMISAPNMRNLPLAELPESDTGPSASLSRALKAYYSRRGLELNGPALRVIQNERSIRAVGRSIEAVLNANPLPAELLSLETGSALSSRNQKSLSRQMMNVYDALLVSSEIQFRVASLQLDDWDTHKDQKQRIEINFSDLFGIGKSLDILSTIIERDFGPDVYNNIVFVFTTDFGRELKANGTAGTDHGEGNYMILVGPQVRGGIYGEMFPESEIPRYMEKSPAITGLTSFERVLGEVADWMGVVDRYAIFPNRDTSPIEPGVSLDSLFAKDASRLVGTVETTDGYTLADTTVSLSNGSDITLTSTTSADGTYVIENIPEGSYSLEATKDGYIIPMSYEYIAPSTSVVKNLVASPDAGTISGRITTPDGMGLSNVTLWDTNRYPETITTDSSGYYIATGYAAGDEVYLNYFSTNYQVVTSGWTSGFFTHTGAAMRGYDFIAIPTNDTRWTGSITGQIVNALGAGIAGVKVWDEYSYPDSLVITNSRGYFEIKGFSSGQQASILASRDGYQINAAEGVTMIFTHNGRTVVGRNFTATLLQGTVSGRVIDSNGNGIAGVSVWDVAKYPEINSTDANGYYVLSGYNIGDPVTINLYKAGYSTSSPTGWDGASFIHDGSNMGARNYQLA